MGTEIPPPRRGACPRCGYRFRLRKDGTVQRHRLYIGQDLWGFCDEVLETSYRGASRSRRRAE